MNHAYFTNTRRRYHMVPTHTPRLGYWDVMEIIVPHTEVTQLIAQAVTTERGREIVLERTAVAKAFASHHLDGVVEIDETVDILCSNSNGDRGSYVQVWIWVPDDDELHENFEETTEDED